MSDQNATTPRVYIARHGETEWTLNGRFTGKTELPLTENGLNQVKATGEVVVGPGKPIDPSKIAHVFCSPRKRALSTFEILLGEANREQLAKDGKVTYTEDIAEWDYGDYEGLKTNEIRAQRKDKGLDKDRAWDIWADGCEGGESAEQVSKRLDRLIQKIIEIQKPHMHGGAAADVLVVAHGHILRAFTKRWLRYPMEFSFHMMMEPGAIGAVSYEHHSVSEPAILVGMGFPHAK